MKLKITVELEVSEKTLDEAYEKLSEILRKNYEYFGWKEMSLVNDKGEVVEEDYA